MKQKKFAIALITNDNYIGATLVLMKTFLKHNKWYKGDFIIMHDNEHCILSENSKKILKACYTNTYFYCVKDHLYDKFVEHFKDIMTFQRFVVSVFTVEVFALKYDPFGNEYDKVLYLDVDQIVTGNIKFLFDSNKSIICGPGDDFLYNQTGNRLIKRNRENIGGGMFCISKEYLGKEFRDDIIKLAENFTLHNPEYDDWDGAGFEMHVLNVWLLDKPGVYIAPTTYQYPSILFTFALNRMSDDFKSIRNAMLHKAKIIHIWDDKPWNKKGNFTPIDMYWNYLYRTLVDNAYKSPEYDFEQIKQNYPELPELYKKYNSKKYRRIFSFYKIKTKK